MMTIRQRLTAGYSRSAMVRLVSLVGVCGASVLGMHSIIVAQRALELPEWAGVVLLLTLIFGPSAAFTWLFTSRVEDHRRPNMDREIGAIRPPVKPRLRKIGGRQMWGCTSGGSTVYGRTPDGAYHEWHRRSRV